MYRLPSLFICLFALSIFNSITLGGAIIIPKLGGGKGGGSGESSSGSSGGITSGGGSGGLGGRPGAIGSDPGSGAIPDPVPPGSGLRGGSEGSRDPNNKDDPATLAGSAAPRKTETPDVQIPDSSSTAGALPQTASLARTASTRTSTPTSTSTATSTSSALSGGAMKLGLDWRLGGAVAGFVGAVGLL